MATTWHCLLVVMISCGLCLSVPAADSQEPGKTTYVTGASVDGAGGAGEAPAPSSDQAAVKPRLQSSPMNALSFESIMGPLIDGFDSIFHFKEMLDKDNVLATDLVDESWAKWIKYAHHLLPLIPVKEVHAQNIENPSKDAPHTMWKQLLINILRGYNIISLDEDNPDHEEKDSKGTRVTHTAVSFDPMGQFFSMATKFVKSVTKYDSALEWWKKVKRDVGKYSAFHEESSLANEKQDAGDDVGQFDLGILDDVLVFGKFDLLKLALNFLTFLGIQSLFWSAYAPTPFTVLEDDYDYDYDYGDDEFDYGDDEGDDYDYRRNDYGDDRASGDFDQGDGQAPNQGFGDNKRRQHTEWPRPASIPQGHPSTLGNGVGQVYHINYGPRLRRPYPRWATNYGRKK